MKPSSADPAWWLCSRCQTEWECSPRRKTQGVRCPSCKAADRKNRAAASATTSWAGDDDPSIPRLAESHPLLAAEWHPTKNGGLTPSDVTAANPRKAWWCNWHGNMRRWVQWKASIKYRAEHNTDFSTSNKPPYKIVVGRNDLTTKHPLLAKGWHPDNSADIAKASGASRQDAVEWLCPSCGLSYSMRPWARTVNDGWCPSCSQKCGKRFDSLYRSLVEANLDVGLHKTEYGRPDIIVRAPWSPKAGHVGASVTMRYLEALSCTDRAESLVRWLALEKGEEKRILIVDGFKPACALLHAFGCADSDVASAFETLNASNAIVLDAFASEKYIEQVTRKALDLLARQPRSTDRLQCLIAPNSQAGTVSKAILPSGAE